MVLDVGEARAAVADLIGAEVVIRRKREEDEVEVDCVTDRGIGA